MATTVYESNLLKSKRKFSIRSESFIMLAMFALVKPDSLSYIGLGILDTLLIVFDVLLIIILGIKISKYRISKMTLLIVIMYFCMAISTILHNGDYLMLAKTAGPAIAAVLLTDYEMQKSPDNYVKAGMKLWIVLGAANLVSIILFPGGMYTAIREDGRSAIGNYLLGFHNGFIAILLPCVGFSMIYAYRKSRGKTLVSKESVISLTILIMTELIDRSATGLVMTAFFLLFVFLGHMRILNKILNPYIFVIGFYVATYLVVILRIQNYFGAIIVGLLNKDLTLTGRVYLWDYAISVIKENWIIGVGQSARSVVGLYRSYNHPHCLVLDLLYKGGIFMFFPFVLLLFKFCRNIKDKLNNPVSKVILMVATCFLIGEIVNSAQYKPYFWIYLVMSNYIYQYQIGGTFNRRDFVKAKGR